MTDEFNESIRTIAASYGYNPDDRGFTHSKTGHTIRGINANEIGVSDKTGTKITKFNSDKQLRKILSDIHDNKSNESFEIIKEMKMTDGSYDDEQLAWNNAHAIQKKSETHGRDSGIDRNGNFPNKRTNEMTNQTVTLIDAIASGDTISSAQYFNDAMKSRISDMIDSRRQEIAQDMFNESYYVTSRDERFPTQHVGFDGHADLTGAEHHRDKLKEKNPSHKYSIVKGPYKPAGKLGPRHKVISESTESIESEELSEVIKTNRNSFGVVDIDNNKYTHKPGTLNHESYDLSYHGKKLDVRKATIAHLGGDKNEAKELHPQLFEAHRKVDESVDHAKMDVGDLINHLAEHPATRDYIDHNAKYDGAHHLGRGVPVHHVAKALGIKPEHVEHAIKRIQDNTENYEGSAEVEGKHVTLHGGD